MLYAWHHCGRGLLVLLLTLCALSVLAATDFEHRPQVYLAGSIAESDVVAERDLLVEDVLATSLRRDQIYQSQPLVFDLSYAAFTEFNKEILVLLNEINGMSKDGEFAALRELDEKITPEVAEDVIVQLAHPEVQHYIVSELMPKIRGILHAGVVGDIHSARVGEAGAVIRVKETGNEVLRPNATALPDMRSVLVQLGGALRRESTLNRRAQKSIIILLSAYLPESLTFNKEITDQRAEELMSMVEPVYYTLQRGEMVVRKGELVSNNQQAKLQAIYSAASSWLQGPYAIGLFMLSSIMSLGLLMAPSGRPSSPLSCKDYVFMALLLASSTIFAKTFFSFAMKSGEQGTVDALAYAFPVAGVVGLVAMVFAARRYCTMGLLLSLFAACMFGGDLQLFFFYFLGGMLSTWLVTKAQSRQDVVWSIIPLTVGQSIFWLASAMLTQMPLAEYPTQLMYVVINSIVSLLMLFAFSPVLELAFGYTTRFRLMELMSLEQPLLQEMMVNMPGTYHHSLVVANMVEAGAKAIGANSLLCKVGALYHDVGKLMHPEYFIENQFGGRNKHDKLAPSMSALILMSHIKKGTEFAEQHKLGKEIQDLIRQHHGTRVIRFFYQKSVNLGENPRESDFRYAGPRPQTKEAAILMLADSVEASCRTLSDPTPARIKSHIDGIMKGIFSEGQLDESELTFKDLHKIGNQFERILTGIFHQRVVYPSGNPNSAVAHTSKEETKIKEQNKQDKVTQPNIPVPTRHKNAEQEGTMASADNGIAGRRMQ